jgi:hypothetical protein
VQVRHSITAGNLSLLPAPAATRMPRIAHFIFGLSPDFGKKPFSLVHYLAIRSAHDRLGPKWKIFVRGQAATLWMRFDGDNVFHSFIAFSQVFFSFEPSSKVSSRLWREIAQLPRVHMFQVFAAHLLFTSPVFTSFKQVSLPQHVDSNGLAVHEVAHNADVLRLRLMRDVGGAYLDADVITVKSFDPLLKVRSGVMSVCAPLSLTGHVRAG